MHGFGTIQADAIGQFENEIRAELQMDGITRAEAPGTRFGTWSALTVGQVTEFRENANSAS